MENENKEYQTVLENIAETTKGCDDSRDIKARGEGYKAFSDADAFSAKTMAEIEQRERELNQRDRELDIRETEINFDNENKKVELELKKEEIETRRAETEAKIKVARSQERSTIIGGAMSFIGSVIVGLIAPILYASTIHGWEREGDYIHNDKNKRPPRFKF